MLEGLCRSLMLIGAVPPLVIGFGADRVASTGVTMNLCIFGAVTAGPSLGGFGGGARLQTPDLERWQEDGEPAWDSPRLPRLRRARRLTGRGAAR